MFSLYISKHLHETMSSKTSQPGLWDPRRNSNYDFVKRVKGNMWLQTTIQLLYSYIPMSARIRVSLYLQFVREINNVKEKIELI